MGKFPPSPSTADFLPAIERLCRTSPSYQNIRHPCRSPQLGLPPPTPLHLARRAPTVVPRRGSATEPTKPSDIVVVGEELVFIVIRRAQVRKVDLVSQQTTDATESLDELRPLL
jgi:hypothetical protein